LFLVSRFSFLAISFFLIATSANAQIKIKEKVEIEPATQTTNRIISDGSGWWIDTCYFTNYDSSEIDLRFTPPSIEPGETTIMKLYYCFNREDCEYDEDGYNLLERNIILEPDVGTITKIGNGKYKYTAPSSTPGDTALVVKVHYEQYVWVCAYGAMKQEVIKGRYSEEDLQCGCPLWTWTQVIRDYGTDSVVIAWDSLSVKIEPEDVYPGDTVQVVIKKRLPDGTLVDFPPEQTYEIAKLEGCMLGNILTNSDSGSYFYDVSQPIYFAAADSLVGDTTGSVLLQVGLVDNEMKKDLPANYPSVIESNDCFSGSFLAENYKLLLFNNYVPIILGWTPGTELITGVPEMPIITMGADPQFPIGGVYTAYWALEIKWVNHNHSYAYTFSGNKLWSSFNGPVIFDIPSETVPLDNTIVGGDELKLTVIIANYKVSKKINDLKILGTYSLSKNLVRDYVSTKLDEPKATFFDLTILYESVFKQFRSSGYVQMNTMSLPSIDFGICQIRRLGKFPVPTLAEIWNWKENVNSGVIIFEEKYEAARTYPQRVREGRTWYWHKKADGTLEQIPIDPLGGHFDWYPKAYPNATDFTNEQLYKEMFQRYPGGVYWRWKIQNPKDLNSGKWIKSPSKRHNRGDEVWVDYQGILNGHFPAEWED